MKSRVVLLFLTILTCLPAVAQEAIEVTYEEDAKGNYILYCTNNNYCKYTVEILFTQLKNLKCNLRMPYKTEVKPGKNLLLTLSPVSPFMGSAFKYTYKSIKGCDNPEADTNFTYLLPLGSGKTTEIFPLNYLSLNKKDPEPKDFYAVGFSINPGDTIYAARRGVVTSLRDTTHLKLSGYVYSSEENYIEICHKDCTFGRYQILQKALVKPGQEVEAGEPIAIAGGQHYDRGAHVRFSVNYNYEKVYDEQYSNGNNVKTYWAFVPLVFHTKETDKARLEMGKQYTSDHPNEFLRVEMSKKQLKKLGNK